MSLMVIPDYGKLSMRMRRDGNRLVVMEVRYTRIGCTFAAEQHVTFINLN